MTRIFMNWIQIPRHGFELVVYILAALGVGALFLGALMTIPPRFRKLVVMGVTFLGGLFFSLEFLIPYENVFTRATPALSNAQIVVASFTLLLGISNLLQFHGRAITKRTSGWYNSAAFLVAFMAIMIAGFMRESSPVANNLFGILYGGFMIPMQATMFSLIAFYIVSAAYRAFRIRSAESALMMAAAAIIMLALVPVGVILTSWIPKDSIFGALRLERLGYWILISPNMAVQRAIAFGIGVGTLAMGLRVWLSLERGSFFDRQL